MPKVLISDKLSPAAVDIFKARGIDVDFKPGLDKDELLATIGNYDGLAIRSNTKVTEEVIAQAGSLKVVGRAGIGVDNVDIQAASSKGIVVMNTPFGNSITTAEHAIAMILSLARDIPAANASTQAGKWEKSRFMGVEVTGKTLGLIGCGNIGSIVANRAQGLKMRVIAFDPFLTHERANELGVEKVELEQMFPRADFITLHTPLTPQTKNIISADAISKMRKGARLINCARGGLVDEHALRAALDNGHLAGAAIDVFEVEPAKENVLFGSDKLVATPHLGAATMEAQEKVALQVAEQMADYLLTGAVTNAVNMPSISADEAPSLNPYVELSNKLGLFAGQLTESAIKEVVIEYEGDVAEMNTKVLTSSVLAGVLQPQLSEVNMVSAPIYAKQRGIKVSEVTRAQQGIFDSYIRVKMVTEAQTRSVAGTIYSNGEMRLIQLKGIPIDAEIAPHMLYLTNEDKPGLIGDLGTLLGEEHVNIATFHLGRDGAGGKAICLLQVDEAIPEEVLKKVAALPLVSQAKSLSF